LNKRKGNKKQKTQKQIKNKYLKNTTKNIKQEKRIKKYKTPKPINSIKDKINKHFCF
jgi:hypothetical protein